MIIGAFALWDLLKHYKLSLPDDVFDSYMRFWRDIELEV
jgi:hypothetical protein